MTIHVLPKHQAADPGMLTFDVTSSSGPYRMLSPFLLGPVGLYAGRTSATMENGWQYAKVYQRHASEDGQPTAAYWAWAAGGWANRRAVRYPMGKGARPLYSLWDGEALDYIEARKQIYVPLYAAAVMLYARPELAAIAQIAQRHDIAIRDYDAYDHRELGYSWQDVIHDPERRMGHGFVLAMMLEGAC